MESKKSFNLESIGQKVDVWTNEWKGLSIESEIRMWDFYGLRPWILKYTPRNGEVLEAGCGLGRYNFLLTNFGINITGLDFSKETIDNLKKWQKENDYNLKFITGEITKLPYDDNSLSGYLSFGVIEHFQEGPKKVLDEVYRVLKPGGIAIITTPNKSWNVKKTKLNKFFRKIIKIIIGKKIIKHPFFQYEYTPKQLKSFMQKSKLFPTEVVGGDYLYSFVEYGKFKGNNIKNNSFANIISPILDRSIFSKFGAQSITISTKVADKMCCFLCGNLNAKKNSLIKFSVPFCVECESKDETKYYLKNNRTGFRTKYLINPVYKSPESKKCTYCSNEYKTDKLFEGFGIDLDVCPNCMSDKNISILLANRHLKPIWRKKK